MHLRKKKITYVADATIQLVNDIGPGMTVELDVVDIYDISSNIFAETDITSIYTILAKSMYKIGWGWTPVRTDDFLKLL
jgi:hypothetical protein